MKYFVFDTETTGLGQQDEVIQFAGYLLDDNFKFLTLHQFYCDTTVKINERALETHKITHAMLKKFSRDVFFEDYFTELKPVLDTPDIVFVGYNVKFDIRLVNQTLTNQGYNAYDFGKKTTTLRNTKGRYYFDLMAALQNFKFGGKPVKLVNAVNTLLNVEHTNTIYDKIANKLPYDSSMRYHSAIYDAFMTSALLQKYGNMFKV